MSAPTRRKVLSGIAATPVLALPAAAISATQSIDDQVHAIWEERAKIIKKLDKAIAKTKTIRDSLPWWAKPGPSVLDNDGNHIGELYLEPAIQNLPLPGKGMHRKIRVSFYDISENYKLHFTKHMLTGTGTRKVINTDCMKASHREKRALIKRLREQKALEDQADYTKWYKIAEQLMQDIYALEKRIRHLAENTATFASIAAWRLINISFDSDGHTPDSFDREYGNGGQIAGICGIAWQLTGRIGSDVTEIANNPDKALNEMAFYQRNL